MSHKPASTIWELGASLSFDEPLTADDDRFVDTASARGDFSFNDLLKPYGLDLRTNSMKFVQSNCYSLFCGHRGCGKSTELRRLNIILNRTDRYFVVFLDALKELDINNLSYTDILMAQAKALTERLSTEGVVIEDIHLNNLKKWFSERIEKHEATKEFAAEIKAGAKASQGIPFLGKLFASLTTSIKTGSTYKEELRTVIRNSFSEFVQAFQQLHDAVADAVRAEGKGQGLLFIVDGTDRLSGADSDNFFIRDAHQLLQIRGNFIYCAPIHMIYENNQLQQIFSNVCRLPMIKIEEKERRDGGKFEKNPRGYDALRELMYKRAEPSLFDDVTTVDYLIECSGGHPRDLLHLLMNAFKKASGDIIDIHAAMAAVKDLSLDYRRTLTKEDFALLCEIDQNPDATPNSEETRKLLYHLALLEYNTYWWRSHPVVRTLAGYQECNPSPPGSDEQA
jgi:energy-coupling factor transporter ATP-binding protein EcfA2